MGPDEVESAKITHLRRLITGRDKDCVSEDPKAEIFGVSTSAFAPSNSFSFIKHSLALGTLCLDPYLALHDLCTLTGGYNSPPIQYRMQSAILFAGRENWLSNYKIYNMC